MRHAILMTVYKNKNQICDIINSLGKDFEFYIHIDKKSSLNLPDFQTCSEDNNIHVYKEFSINWGSVNHLKAILLLSKKALEDKRNGFFHLITGQDFPVKSKDYFKYELDIEKDYLDYFEMPAKFWVYGGFDRIEFFNFYELFDFRKFTGRIIISLTLKIQKILKIKRENTLNKFFKKLYGGSTYWSLTRNSLQYVDDFTDENIMNSMKFTFCAEEIYIPTVLLNSEYAGNIVNDNLRYIDWSSGRGGFPAFLDATDYDKIKSSNKIFARKFHEESSEELKKLLNMF